LAHLGPTKPAETRRAGVELRVCLVDAHISPTKYLVRVGCQNFGQGILSPRFANFLARICEGERWACIGSQNFGYKPNTNHNSMGNQFFGGATWGTKPNTPVFRHAARARATQTTSWLATGTRLLWWLGQWHRDLSTVGRRRVKRAAMPTSCLP
jgi:hypothetical protein